MRDNIIGTLLIFFVLVFSGCGFAGTHGKIKSYNFDYTNDELVSIVDAFLLANPKCNPKTNSAGWVLIESPSNGDQFGFSIGGNSEIVLITAGLKGGRRKISADLSFFIENKLIKSFEENFIEKIKLISPKPLNILRTPFTLSTNGRNDWWPNYVIKYDTLVRYSLPVEIDSLGIEYFEDLFISYSDYSDNDSRIYQYKYLFRLDDDYSGYLKDNSIYIDTYYRGIGEKRKFEPIFETKEWKGYISDSRKKERIDNYQKIRDMRVSRGGAPSRVNHILTKQYWMEKILESNLDSL